MKGAHLSYSERVRNILKYLQRATFSQITDKQLPHQRCCGEFTCRPKLRFQNFRTASPKVKGEFTAAARKWRRRLLALAAFSAPTHGRWVCHINCTKSSVFHNTQQVSLVASQLMLFLLLFSSDAGCCSTIFVCFCKRGRFLPAGTSIDAQSTMYT